MFLTRCKLVNPDKRYTVDFGVGTLYIEMLMAEEGVHFFVIYSVSHKEKTDRPNVD